VVRNVLIKYFVILELKCNKIIYKNVNSVKCMSFSNYVSVKEAYFH
jgi:hypothetical protein